MSSKIKVLGVHGSPRKAATAYTLKRALEYAQELADVETEFVELRKMEIHPCTHCNRCLSAERVCCPRFDDDMKFFYERLPEIDVLVLATPVYQMAPAAQVHAFMNRLRPLGKACSTGHWATKVGVGIAVGGARNGGEETTLDALNRFFITEGMCIAGGGVYTYNGGSIWSNDGLAAGAEKDLVGMKTVAVAVRRAVTVSKLLKAGAEAYPQLDLCHLAGFRDQEDMDWYRSAFFNRSKPDTDL
ncbi:MAG: flavodoxin family protein [Bacillota bacterium]